MILVFGSINIDLLMSVSSLPAAGETVLTHEFQQSPGGKGANQALASQRAGIETKFVGSVGADSYADKALSLLRYEQVDISLVTVSERSTGCAVVLVDDVGMHCQPGCEVVGEEQGHSEGHSLIVMHRVVLPSVVLRHAPTLDHASIIALPIAV